MVRAILACQTATNAAVHHVGTQLRPGKSALIHGSASFLVDSVSPGYIARLMANPNSRTCLGSL
jgi:hypothetical protein